ncbi:MAG: prepilin-type N-terminal cleavage/methylation domain-containing protein [Planctomycetes bacterium]|nr:prepilin-type N-terminal cleavage/methylation domain-containing protein [Planctomycetota bacterium]
MKKKSTTKSKKSVRKGTSKKSGFTLIELMIVVAIIAIIAAIAIPSLLNARKSGNEASAISSLRTLCTVNEQYRTRYQAYGGSLANLNAAGYIDSVLSGGAKSGYTFTYASTSANTWTCNANPTTAGTTGDRGFFADQTGVIRFVASGAADATSAPLD